MKVSAAQIYNSKASFALYPISRYAGSLVAYSHSPVYMRKA